MALPTHGRRSGLGGLATIDDGATPTPASLYDGADVQEWTLEATQATLDASTKSDTAEVSQIGRKAASGTIKKLVAGAEFAKSSLLGTVLHLALTSGDGTTLGGDEGDTIFDGNIVVTKVGYQSPDGLEAEDLAWKTIDDDFVLCD